MDSFDNIKDKLMTAKECCWIETNDKWHYVSNNEGIDKVKEGKHVVVFEGFDTNPFTDITNDLLIEGEGDPTIHVYISPKGATSVYEHRDPCYVVFYCLEGTKTMMLDGIEYSIDKGEHMVIEPNTPHCATNKHYSITLSIGFENKLLT